MKSRHANLLLLAVLLITTHSRAQTLDEVLSANTDLWGESALHQPGGPTYEYFEKLLPPLRYVDASFHHYPIVLSAPSNPTKARLISNGSAVNALARSRSWINETGTPV